MVALVTTTLDVERTKNTIVTKLKLSINIKINFLLSPYA